MSLFPVSVISRTVMVYERVYDTKIGRVLVWLSVGFGLAFVYGMLLSVIG